MGSNSSQLVYTYRFYGPIPVIRFFFLLAAALSSPLALSQSLENPIDYETARLSRIVRAVRIMEEISLDGRLDEPAWTLAIPATDFIQQQPNTGQLSRERTEVRFLYDENNLYVGINCFDSDALHIAVNELREDFNINDSDSMVVNIDSLRDRRSGFNFAINPSGAKRDGQIFNDGQFNIDWDGVWDAKTTRTDEGWFVEMAIPFKTLRFSNAALQEWGLHINRRIARLNEVSQWSPVPIRFSGGRMSMAGTLTGLENIQPGRNFKVKPFVTAAVTEFRDSGTDTDYDGGVDAKYSLTPSLTMDLTYRTDFAQVEVDQQQVNLTRFNLFFPEKRDFFLENSAIFNFAGAANSSNLVPFFSRRIGLSAAGTPVPILGGTRVSGKINQYDVGFLAMKTRSENGLASNNFIVGRIKRNLHWANSWIGGMMTSRDSTAAGDYNRVYGPDLRLQFFERLEFESYFLRSDSPSMTGHNQARRFASAWREDEYTIAAEYNAVQASFKPDLGFVRRENVTQYAGELAWRPQLRESELVQNLVFSTTLDYNEGAGSGKVETRSQAVNLGMVFENGAQFNFNADQTFDRLAEPFPIRSNLSIAAGDYQYLGYSATFNTRPAVKIRGNGNVNWGEFWNGNRKSFGGGIVVRPNYHLNVDLTYSRNRVTLPNGSFTTELVGTRFLYAFTPRAFLNAFIQYNADTHQVSSNIRFNLTHHPLSDLYLVYNDRRDTTNGQLVERAFIIKFTNLFDF
jgi:hypothetical protein